MPHNQLWRRAFIGILVYWANVNNNMARALFAKQRIFKENFRGVVLPWFYDIMINEALFVGVPYKNQYKRESKNCTALKFLHTK